MFHAAASGPSSIPPPPSFNEFSFMSIGPRRSLLNRLNMAPQASPQPGEPANPPLLASAPAPIDTSTIFPALDTSLPSLGTSATANPSFSLGPVTPPIVPDDPLTAGPNLSLAKSSAQTKSSHSVPTSDMEVDERADPEIVELPRPPPPRVPESYRSLSADHYFVAPPAVLPYPRSPPLRIDEDHFLYTPAGLYAHLPRAPPLSPRLDLLTVLELETSREQSEWEQVCHDLGRPTLNSSTAENRSRASLGHNQPGPQASLLVRTDVARSPSAPASVPTSAVDLDSDVDSSDVELRVYDNASPIASRTKSELPSPDLDTVNPSLPTRGASQSSPEAFPASDLSGSSTTQDPVAQHVRRRSLFDMVPRRTESAFGKDGAGPSSFSIPNKEATRSESTSTTPAKRKHDAMDGSSQDAPKPPASEQPRVGVPPPLRASVGRTPAPASTPVPEVSSAPSASVASPANSVPTQVVVDGVTRQSPRTTAQAPTPVSESQPMRKPCRFYNRPPGRVCVRKEQCPDLHEGPLQRPLPPAVLASSAVSTFPGFGVTNAPGSTSPAIPTSTTTPPTTRPETPAVTQPLVSATPAPVTPSATVTLTPVPAVVPASSKPAAPVTVRVSPAVAPTAPPMAKRTNSTGLPSRPSSSVTRPTTPCKFFNSSKGCTRMGFCPFRHGDEPGAAMPPSGSGASANGVPPAASGPKPVTNRSLATGVQLPSSGGSSRVSPKADVVVNAPAMGPGATPNKGKAPIGKADVVVKTERESPAPKLSGKAAAPKAKPRAAPPLMSRAVKEEEVSIRDLGGDLLTSSDQEMADGIAQNTLDNEPVLPPSLSSAPSAQPPKPLPPSNQPKAPTEPRLVEPAQAPAAVHEQPPMVAAKPAQAPVAPISASPPVASSTVVIPPTPAHLVAAKTGTAPQPSVAPVRPPSRDSRRLDPRDRRAGVVHIVLPIVQGGPYLAPPHHHALGGDLQLARVVIHRHMVELILHLVREDTRRLVHAHALAHVLGHSRLREGGVALHLHQRGLEDTHLGAQSHHVTILVTLSSPSPHPRNGYVVPRKFNAPRSDRWSPGRSPRAPSPRLPTYSRPNLDARVNEYRPRAESRLVPSNRSPLPTASHEERGYSNDPAHYPPEVNAARTWETNDRRSPLPQSTTNYDRNARTSLDIQEPARPSHPSGHSQDPNYDSGLRPGFSVGMPQASSTPGRPSILVEPSNNVNLGLPKKPIVMPANFDNFDQSTTMEIASPEAQRHAPARLQERVEQYPGFAPAGFVPVEAAPSLYTRMTQSDQLPLAERLASSETHQPNKTTSYNKGPKPAVSNNNGHLAARLGVNSGDRSQPLANRLQDESRARSSYQNRDRGRDREPPARPGGGLMARMVGDKKSG